MEWPVGADGGVADGAADSAVEGVAGAVANGAADEVADSMVDGVADGGAGGVAEAQQRSLEGSLENRPPLLLQAVIAGRPQTPHEPRPRVAPRLLPVPPSALPARFKEKPRDA